MVKLPDKSVIVPLPVPFTTMFAPIIGSPSLSTTVPTIFLPCSACALLILASGLNANAEGALPSRNAMHAPASNAFLLVFGFVFFTVLNYY